MPALTLQRSTTIDWIACTVADVCENEVNLAHVGGMLTNTVQQDWGKAKPVNGYKIAARHTSGAFIMSGRADMGTHLIVSGSALTDLRMHGEPTPDLIDHLLESNARFARLDLALDVVDSRLNFLRVFRAFKSGKADTRATVYLLVQSGDHGWTLYVGSPKSDKFFRLYNKYAEVKRKALVPEGVEDWVRFELALSNTWAQRAARMVQASGQSSAVLSNIRAFASVPSDPKWVASVEGDVNDVGMSVRKLTDTQAWLMGPVAKSLARESLAHPGTLMQFIDAVKKERANLLQPEYKRITEPMA